MEGQRSLIAALQAGTCLAPADGPVQVIETHISWVLLAGGYAYKFKKALDLGFLDYSTLARRRHACAEELRLNRRTAPDLYIDVIAIGGTAQEPRVVADGPAIEYAVRMHRFAGAAQLDEALAHGGLSGADMVEAGSMIAAFHAGAARASSAGRYGSAASVRDPALQNFDQIQPLLADGEMRAALARLRAWTEVQFPRLQARMEERLQQGRVRECHGDLHLANMVRHGGRIVAFDCIEFNPMLRWIDVISDLAFVLMDLHHRGRADLARLLLDTYLERSGDFDGIRLLPFYLVYRAMVRAKVAAIRAAQAPASALQSASLRDDCRTHLLLAEALSRQPPPMLVFTHGVSGSGKTFASGALLQARDWIRVRADVERQRIAGAQAQTSSGAATGAGIYSQAVTAAVYARLAEVADSLLGGGSAVIVDATFLKRSQRDLLRGVAMRHGVPCVILAVEADPAVQASRIQARQAAGVDASEATVEVMRAQIAACEPLQEDEIAFSVRLDTRIRFDAEAVAARLERVALQRN
jgi:aminoglycoside phosphotransferase family enzyme/predicted kinase